MIDSAAHKFTRLRYFTIARPLREPVNRNILTGRIDHFVQRATVDRENLVAASKAKTLLRDIDHAAPFDKLPPKRKIELLTGPGLGHCLGKLCLGVIATDSG